MTVTATDENCDSYENFVDLIFDKTPYHFAINITITRDEAYKLREELNEVLTHT